MQNAAMAEGKKKHRWKFFRVGGVDQVSLETGEDILHLDELDPKLWMALSMPTRGVDLDPRTLDLLDTDKDGHVRLPEVLDAVKWLRANHGDPDRLLTGSDELPLDAIKPPLRDAAKQVLASLGKKDATSIALADVADTAKIFEGARLNGDGVVPPEAAPDPETRKVLEDIVTARGGVVDRSGKKGVDAEQAKAFFADVKNMVLWYDRAGSDRETFPIGEATADAWTAVTAVRPKVEDYFTRTRLASLDPRAAAATLSDAEWSTLASQELRPDAPELARLALARIEPNKPLPLTDSVNPAWAPALAALGEKAVKPLLGDAKTVLTESDWRAILKKLSPYEAAVAKQPLQTVDKLPRERVRALSSSELPAAIDGLIAEDAAKKPDFDRVADVEKLLRLQRDFGRLLRNFASFSDFYARKGAVFQAGTLFLDARGCDLVVDVTDGGKHASLAGLAGAYLVYCDCTRGAEKRQIAAAFTAGDADNLMVGRNGVFYDRKGKDYHATITKIIENPISVRQAFWAPYKKLARMLEEQVAKRASAANSAADAKLATAATTTANLGKVGEPAAAPAPPKKIDVGTVAAIGVAIGGIGALVTGILAAFLGLGLWMPIGVVALLLMISGPSMLLAWLKLRQRNLGPILDANGWAVNGRARINVPFGTALTLLAKQPEGSKRITTDPYADKKRPWGLYIFLAVLVGLAIAWYLGKVDKYLPHSARSVTVLGDAAPAAKKPPPTPETPTPGTATSPQPPK